MLLLDDVSSSETSTNVVITEASSISIFSDIKILLSIISLAVLNNEREFTSLINNTINTKPLNQHITFYNDIYVYLNVGRTALDIMFTTYFGWPSDQHTRHHWPFSILLFVVTFCGHYVIYVPRSSATNPPREYNSLYAVFCGYNPPHNTLTTPNKHAKKRQVVVVSLLQSSTTTNR